MKKIMELLQSASKLVFVLMAGGVIAATFMHIVDPKDFMMLAAMAFSFYFTTKASDTGGEDVGK